MGKRTHLLTARARQNWTLEQAAERIGCAPNTLNRWELGVMSPSAYHRARLCEVYQATLEELGLDVDETSVSFVPSASSEISFLKNDLTMHLFALAYARDSDIVRLQQAIEEAIKGFEAMNNNPASTITRREALSRLALLPLLSLGVPGKVTLSPQNSAGVLQQCAASIAACNELCKSRDFTDLAFISSTLSSYIPTLQSIVRDSSTQRKTAARLLAQSFHLKTMLAWHLENIKQAAQYAQQATSYARQAEDISLFVSIAIYQAWVAYYDNNPKQALTALETASPYLSHPTLSSSLSVQLLSAKAVMQAKSGLESGATIMAAYKLNDTSQPFAFESTSATLIGNHALAAYHSAQYDQAFQLFSQLIDEEKLDAKYTISERARSEMLNYMTLSALKSPKRDQERLIFYWTNAIQIATTLQSEQRFNEALTAYNVMDALWPGEARIHALRPLATHW